MSTDTADAIDPAGVADLESLYERMLRIRLLEDAVHRLFLNNEVEGTTHLYQGQEAVAVGVFDVLQPGDTVAATYRGHGACLAMGVDQTAILAEFLGRETGTNGGRGGSMNVIDLEHGIIGCFGIVGGSIAAATGAALASQLRKDGSVAVAFFGDGAVNQAYFHECLNFAGVRKLPVVYVCENNLYGEWSAMGAVTAGGAISARAAAYGMPGIDVDGNDVLAVRMSAVDAVARARAGDGPTLLEAKTYRHKGHSRVDPGKYRPKEEVEEWLGRDPIPQLGSRLDDGDGRPDPGEHRARRLERALAGRARRRRIPARASSPAQRLKRRELADMTEISFRDAIRDGLAEEMERDGSVVLIGEDVEPGGVFNVTPGLVERFGHDRVVDTPISELAFTSAAFGAAVKGLRPVVEIMFGDFLGLVVDTLVNQASKYWYISNEQASVPLVVRSAVGAGARFGACHSQTPISWFLAEPGLKLVAASTPADAKGLMKAAIRDDNPVVVFEHKMLYGRKGEVADGDAALVPIGKASVRRSGGDVTIVAAMAGGRDVARRGRGTCRRRDRGRGRRPAVASSARLGHDRHVRGEDEAPGRRRGGTPDGWLRGRRRRDSRRAGGPDQRETRHDARHSGALQRTPRGRSAPTGHRYRGGREGTPRVAVSQSGAVSRPVIGSTPRWTDSRRPSSSH